MDIFTQNNGRCGVSEDPKKLVCEVTRKWRLTNPSGEEPNPNWAEPEAQLVFVLTFEVDRLEAVNLQIIDQTKLKQVRTK
jgi:hypothetical protein